MANTDKKESFVFYRSFYEALQNVPKKHRAEVYEAVFAYAFDSQQPSLTGVSRALWELIRPQLDASEKRYENAKKGAEYGKMGGRPRKKDAEEKPLKGYETKTLNDNHNLNENYNDNVNANSNSNLNASVPEEVGSPSANTETIPTFKEVADEVAAQKYEVSASKFWMYYDKSGWKTTTGEPIRDWRKMLKVWNQKEKGEIPTAEPANKKKKNKFNNFEQREYSNAELERQLLELE